MVRGEWYIVKKKTGNKKNKTVGYVIWCGGWMWIGACYWFWFSKWLNCLFLSYLFFCLQKWLFSCLYFLFSFLLQPCWFCCLFFSTWKLSWASPINDERIIRSKCLSACYLFQKNCSHVLFTIRFNINSITFHLFFPF